MLFLTNRNIYIYIVYSIYICIAESLESLNSLYRENEEDIVEKSITMFTRDNRFSSCNNALSIGKDYQFEQCQL